MTKFRNSVWTLFHCKLKLPQGLWCHFVQVNTVYSSYSWHLWSCSVWTIKLTLKTRHIQNYPLNYCILLYPFFPLWLPWKNPNIYNQKTSHRSQKNLWQYILHDIPSKHSRVTIWKQDWYVLPTNYLDIWYSINCQAYECVCWTSQ